MKRVVLVGCYKPYRETWMGDASDEIWGVNRAYTLQRNLTRVYFVDRLSQFKKQFPTFVDDLNFREIPVVAKRYYPEIPRSRPYPLRQLLASFGMEKPYFTNAVAFMLAEAIFERFEEIVLHRMNVRSFSTEYMSQKACLDFWCGVAVGRGIKVLISDDSLLCRPHPWEPPLYGYQEVTNYMLANQILAGALGYLDRIKYEVYDVADDESLIPAAKAA